MKVYVVIETDYNCDIGETPQINILGVFGNKEKSIKEMEKEINNNIQEFEFVKDEQGRTERDNSIYEIIFWGYQENWNNYIEYRIEEREVE